VVVAQGWHRVDELGEPLDFEGGARHVSRQLVRRVLEFAVGDLICTVVTCRHGSASDLGDDNRRSEICGVSNCFASGYGPLDGLSACPETSRNPCPGAEDHFGIVRRPAGQQQLGLEVASPDTALVVGIGPDHAVSVVPDAYLELQDEPAGIPEPLSVASSQAST
jgi:hypothetical protein